MAHLIHGKASVVWIEICVALVTHAWVRKHEPKSLTKLLLGLIITPSCPVAILWSSHWGTHVVWQPYVIFYTALLLSIVTYRISPFHPLAQHPGPILCKVSKLWLTYVAYRGKLHEYHKYLHDTYGQIVRVGPNELSITDKEYIPLVLGSPGLPKGPLWDGRIVTSANSKNKNNSLISVPDLQRHAQLRKPWNKAFGSAPLKDFADILTHKALELSGHLVGICWSSQNHRAHIDLAQWISFFSFDFMGDMAFDGSFELMRNGDKDGLWRGMESALLTASLSQHIPWIANAIRAMPFTGKGMRDFGAFAVKQAKLRSTKEVYRRDLFYHLLNVTDPDSTTDPFPVIVSNSVLTIIAGSDTSATVLSNIIFYLLVNHEYLVALRAEIDQNFPFAEQAPIIVTKLAGMKLLNAIINETLRLLPPLPISIQRAPQKGSGGKFIGKTFIPEGTGINIPPYCLHRDPRYFAPRTEEFWPERWLIDNPGDPNFILDLAAFIPFSFGPANCAGKPLAMLELRYITTMLVRQFDISFETGFETDLWEKNLLDRFVLTKGPLPVVLSLRGT
ncbi:hypothetical protein GALMADRAFT_250743 [Galerina marginata CBS 339.88]|uniref:Cytochrome P450 n=1 Tax=Galerina marginata (strain CBS 339.88) TaxID=685588 RepID=A0A067T274_GALM3|nr:hypothetical protein GALMADRAFT_250743 [Galerina marginata CBS 339.88]